MDIIQIITEFFGENKWLNVFTALIALASAIAAVTPTPKKGSKWEKIYKILVDLPAINIGKAKDKGDGNASNVDKP